jgi:nucleotide-binding universal stress UspA family protein
MKIVVATDFSSNSKKGILFAIQLAKQTDCELIFYNVVQIFQPTIWETSYYNVYEVDELQRSQSFLENFIGGIFLDNNLENHKYSCVSEIGVSAGNEIIEFAKKQKANFICVSTVGSGKLMQLFGTTASELIAFSPIPTLIIPVNYNIKPISDLFFASDFVNFEEEFNQIHDISKLINSKLNIYHFDYQKVLESNENKFDKISSRHKSDKVHFHLRSLDSGKPLLKQLETEIKNENPSLIVVFTKQNRNWFDRLFLSSLSDELAFDTKTPMLVFKKDIIEN